MYNGRLIGSAGLLLLLLLGSCSAYEGRSPMPSSQPSATLATPRYLALGDSYTIGESVATADRWPVQLATLLRQEGLAIAEPEIIARTGWTTGELRGAIERASPQGPYALVSLLVGVNNQYRGRGVEEYRAEFRDLLERSINLAGGEAGHVLVLSIPDWGVTPFARSQNVQRIGAEIDRFNAVNREETVRTGAHYIDITIYSRRAAEDRALIASDGLHPSGVMYAEWARLALPAAREALGGQASTP